jgi:zinc and cadmium transporter
MSLFFYIFAFSLLGSIFSLAGGVILLFKPNFLKKTASYFISFAAGVLLSVSFLDLLPHAIEEAKNGQIFTFSLLAASFFFILEKGFAGFHHHAHEEYDRKKVTNLLVLIGDSLHNFIDGIVIGISFLTNIPLGIVTSLAVAAHEIPQEIADFSIFLSSGMKPAKAFFLNLFSALFTVFGAFFSFFYAKSVVSFKPQLIAAAAGMFIYIACSDLIPQLHHEKEKKKIVKQTLAFVLGILIIYLVSLYHG